MSTPSGTSPFAILTTPPDLERPDVGIVVVTELEVGGHAQQQALLEASRRAWDALPWPTTLAGITWLTSFDGTRALAYVQWTDDSEFALYGQTHRPALAAALRAAVPGLVAAPPTFYRRYRSVRKPEAPVAGAIVIVQIDFDGPDEARQRAWIDAVFEALAADASPPAGGLGAHFHLSTDGARVLNYAEWIDEASHQAALDRSGGRSVGSGEKWRTVQTFPGLTGSRVTRYRFERQLVPARPGGRS
jgi:hypothetical protein